MNEINALYIGIGMIVGCMIGIIFNYSIPMCVSYGCLIGIVVSIMMKEK